MSNEKYITRLCMGECSMGSMKNYLNLPEDHGIIFNDMDHPIMNANDHEGGKGKHVVHFGRCNSQTNPGNIGQSILGALIPGSMLLKKMMGCSGCKCSPMTFMPWMEDKKDHLIEGAPALTDKSKLMCFYGGVITIVPPDEAKADDEEYNEAEHKEYDE